MKLVTSLVVMAGVLGLAGGCSDAPDYGVEVKKTPAAERVRSMLEGIAQRGELDSSAMILESQIEEMKEEGAPNTDALIADAKELLALKSPSAIRKKAEEMLEAVPEKPATTETAETE